MAAASTARTIATTATSLVTAPDLSGGYVIVASPLASAADVFIGGPGVTTATGLPLVPGASYTFDLQAAEDLFGIVAAGTVTVRVLALGL